MPKVLTFGKAYRVRKGSALVALALPVRGRMRLVRWTPGGRLVTHSWAQAQAIVMEPGVGQLLALWRVDVEVLDAFVERQIYARSQDVRDVRRNPERRA